jgi:hypothetical protein
MTGVRHTRKQTDRDKQIGRVVQLAGLGEAGALEAFLKQKAVSVLVLRAYLVQSAGVDKAPGDLGESNVVAGKKSPAQTAKVENLRGLNVPGRDRPGFRRAESVIQVQFFRARGRYRGLPMQEAFRPVLALVDIQQQQLRRH